MKKYLIILFALSTSLTCWGMELKEEKKSTIVKHSGSAERVYPTKDTTALFFYINQKRDNENKSSTLKLSNVTDDYYCYSTNHENNLPETLQQDVSTNDRDYALEVYDVKTNKIIKTSNNYSFLDLMFLWPNRCLPRYFATPKEKDDQNFCSVYDLQQNGKKIFTTKIDDEPFGFGFANNGTLLFANLDKLFKIYNLKNQEYKETKLDDATQHIFLSPDSKHALVYVGKMGGLYLHYDFENNIITPLSNFQNDSGFTFNDASTYISFFDKKDSTIKLYDTKQREVVKKQKLDASTMDFRFTHDSSIIFSTDKKNFKLWDTNNDKIIDLVSFATEHSVRGGLTRTLRDSNKLYYFYDNQNNKVTVYDFVRNKLFAIEISEVQGLLDINDDISYATWSGRNNKISFYTTDEWKLFKTLIFENSQQIYGKFSPCGNYFVVSYLNSDEKSCGEGNVEIYDIKKDAIVLKTPYMGTDGGYYKTYSTIIALKSDEKTLLLYDYKNNSRATITTKDEINHFMINEVLVVVSAGEQSELFTWDEIVFKEENNQKNEKSGYCSIA